MLLWKDQHVQLDQIQARLLDLKILFPSEISHVITNELEILEALVLVSWV